MMTLSRSIKAPRTRVLIPAFVLLFVIDIAILYGYPLFWGILVGLFMDVVGAIILAIPDTRFIWIQTFSGRLNYAKETLDGTGRGGFSVLCRPGKSPTEKETEIGFLEFLEVITPLLEDGVSSHAHGLHFVEEGLDPDEIDRISAGSATDVALFDDLPDSSPTGYKGWTSGRGTPYSAVFFYPKRRVDKEINSQVEKYKTRIRRLGLVILISGFIQQLMFLVLQNFPI